MIYTQDKVNLHTHSFYCGHGKGSLADFAETAKLKGCLQVLGFSEHCPVPNDELPNRMLYSMLDSYTADIDNLRNEGRIIFLKGAECDWDEKYFSFYKDILLGEKHFDYLLGSIHYLQGDTAYIPHLADLGIEGLKTYSKQYIGMLQSGLFGIGCHPDLFYASYRHWDNEAIAVSKDIISCAKENGIALELNDLGLRKKMIQTEYGLEHQYSIAKFWTLAAESGVKICTNTDAHRPEDLHGYPEAGFINASFKMASELGIKFTDWDISPTNGNRYRISSCN